jgi:sulfatase modifying factor 1
MRTTSLLCVALIGGCTLTNTPDRLRDCAVCPEMVTVPSGVAILGATPADGHRRPDELPERTFTISEPFAVSRYEITRDQYEAFVRATGRRVGGDCLSDRRQRGNWVHDAETTFLDPGFSQAGNHPVACVNWVEANAYVDWLNTQTGGGYRLLTEVEWEYVARGGAANAVYPWGNDPAKGCAFANGFDQTAVATYKRMDTSGYKVYDPLACTDGWLNTTPVGSLEPNAFGIYDMIGNVSEWIEDCHAPSHEAVSEAGAPPVVEGACARRIAKGGSWGTLGNNLRTAERFPYAQTHRDDSIGIRVAKSKELNMGEAAPVYDWKNLLARCERWGRKRAEWQRFKGLQITSDWLPSAATPATEAQIAREEARLGVRLPPSLRSFYLQSNGHGVVGNFIWAVRSVEQLGWLRDVEPHLYDLVFEDDAAVARSLVVSGEADASWWLLDPGDVDGRGEWRAGRWSSWNPGILWIAEDFFGLFQNEVSGSEQLLAREQFPPPAPGTGRRRNELSVGDINSSTLEGRIAPNGYMYVPAEGFVSRVTVTAQPVARVGEWVLLNATRRSGPWNPMKREEVRPGEISMFEPPIFEREVAASLSWSVDPPGSATFNAADIEGADPSARSVMFGAPGIYKLQGYSAFPLPVLSNSVTIRVE